MPKPHIDVSRWHSSSFLSNQHSQPLNIPICCIKQDFLAHRLICCFGILLPSYSISGCYTIPPCCTGRRRWPQKLLHLPSWMTPRWLHTIRKAGDVKNGWHKYNYVIHTGCMVKKKGQQLVKNTPTPHFGISTWQQNKTHNVSLVKSNLQEPLRSSEATGTCRFFVCHIRGFETGWDIHGPWRL